MEKLHPLASGSGGRRETPGGDTGNAVIQRSVASPIAKKAASSRSGGDADARAPRRRRAGVGLFQEHPFPACLPSVHSSLVSGRSTFHPSFFAA